MTNATIKKTFLVLSAAVALGVALSLGAFAATVHADDDLGYGFTYDDNLGYGYTYDDNLGYGYTYDDNLGYGYTYDDNLGYGYTYDDNLGYGYTYDDNLGYGYTYDDNLGYGYTYDDNLGYGYTYDDNLGYGYTSCDYSCYSSYAPGYSPSYRSFGTPSFSSYAPSMPSYRPSMPSYVSYPSAPSYAPRPVQQQQQQQQQQGGGSQPINIVNNNNNTNTNNNVNTVTVLPVETVQRPVQYVYQQPVQPVYQNLYCVITVVPNSISSGGYATLSWTSTGATSAYLSDGIGSVQTTGMLQVRPNVSKTYTLTVTGAGGTRTCSAYVNVNAGAPYVSLSQIPYTGFDLGPIGNTLYWLSLISFAAAGAYLLIYYKGGAALVTSSAINGFARKIDPVVTPVAEKLEKAVPVLPIMERSVEMTDRMVFTSGKHGEAPRIVIARN